MVHSYLQRDTLFYIMTPVYEMTLKSIITYRYFSSSPPPLSPEGREEDIDAILSVIRDAKRFVHIAVMDFVPAFLYTEHKDWDFSARISII